MNKFKYFDSKYNYLRRKILLGILSFFFFIILILQFTMFNRFAQRIEIEYNFISSGESSAGLSIQEIYNLSTAYKLKELFTWLNSLVVFTTFMILFILSFIQYLIYTNKSNGDKHFKLLFYLIPLVFVLMFLINALQPTEVTRGKYIFSENESNWIIFAEKISNKMNYTTSWISMILAFISIILVIVAKKSFGFIQKDIILNSLPPETEDLKKEIKYILDNSKQ
ncbi:hypothetical protein NW066_00280 [Mycoplasmopsis felis]|uniref:hypothetical protein n=1 Tax=Mycoplasmopsis felis TaxID=33923 RepID=UPI0021AE6CA2|nr:hypothetical protein [Mycoplasmopsis felis]MCU9938961.1 hypothetical protein [Mycoplasmopsis felis]UWV80135.1 hypothetical protein NW072_03435 [Mycoplasmopsis felis]UWV85196.1 hypothetical protein NW066_00280 [Mycoplasmopsis felis]